MKQFILIILLLSSINLAQEETALELSQERFYSLLVGQTIEGEWAGRAFVQSFFVNGRTRYQEGNSPISWGTWRIREDAWYCSVWPPSEQESCYKVDAFEDNRLRWHSGENRYESRIVLSESETTE